MSPWGARMMNILMRWVWTSFACCVSISTQVSGFIQKTGRILSFHLPGMMIHWRSLVDILFDEIGCISVIKSFDSVKFLMIQWKAIEWLELIFIPSKQMYIYIYWWRYIIYEYWCTHAHIYILQHMICMRKGTIHSAVKKTLTLWRHSPWAAMGKLGNGRCVVAGRDWTLFKGFKLQVVLAKWISPNHCGIKFKTL